MAEGVVVSPVFDGHNVIGLYAGLFLWIAAFTGVLIGFEWGEQAIYAMTHSSRPKFTRPPQSNPVAARRGSRSIKRSISRGKSSRRGGGHADSAARPEGFVHDRAARSEETSGSAHSSVTVDPYTGKVLQVHNFLNGSQGYRWIRFNRAIHTGDVWGLLATS